MRSDLRIYLLLLLCLPLSAYAEGSKELLGNDCNNFGFLEIWDNNDPNRPFATYNCAPEYRLNLRVNAGEMIHFGYSTDIQDVWYRLKDPNGNIVMGPTLINSASGTGWITQCGKGIKGPSTVVGGGYSPLLHSATLSGDYYIEFAVNNNATTIQKRVFTNFDVTVTNGAAVKTGRLWSKSWDITLMAFNNPFLATMYAYSTDSIVTKFNFNGIQPYGFVISCNSYGASNVGTLLERRRSDYRANIFSNGGIPGVPEFPLFLNPPDTLLFPSGQVGFIDSVSLSSCSMGSNCINVFANKAGQAEVNFDFPGGGERTLLETVNQGMNCIFWDGLDHNGNTLNTYDTVHVTIRYATGITHLPLMDVENHLNGYTVTLERPTKKPDGTPLPTPTIFWDDTLITDYPNALDGVTNLDGCTAIGGCHRWQNRGLDNTNPEIINTWWYVNMEVMAFTVICPVVLNVDLAEFSGTNTEKGTWLQWKTAAYYERASFELQKSYDAHDFSSIYKTQSKGEYNFSYLDERTENIGAQKIYYRLKMEDDNGEVSYSHIIEVRIPAPVRAEIYYSQQTKSLTISSGKQAYVEYYIFDSFGRMALTGEAATDENIYLDLLPGIYFVKVHLDNATTISQKIYIP